MNLTRLFALSCACFLLLLTACGGNPKLDDANLAWGFEGKFSLRSPDKNQSGYIKWEQYDKGFKVKLWGVLGLGTTHIYGNDKRIIIDDGKQQLRLKADQPLEVFPNVWLPVGDIASDAQRILLNADNMQPYLFGPNDSWEARTLQSISYSKLARPTKIQVQNDDTRLKIIMKRWF